MIFRIIPCLMSAFMGPFFWGSLWGQSRIIGRVQDENSLPVVQVNMLLLNPLDSALITGCVTAENGAFVFENVAPGNYLLRTTFLGYTDQYTGTFAVQTESIDLGVLRLLPATTVLQTVELVAQRPFLEQKTDRLIVNVAQSVTYSGGTALEVLRRTPGVQVNSQTQTISLSGKQGVAVMINGKLSRIPDDALVQMLEGISANSIDHIEIIHTPPANFEAEGNAGIIHIVLKESNNEGVNGSYTLNAGYGKREKWGGNANINFRNNELNVFGKYDGNFNINPQTFSNYRSVRQGNDIAETQMSSHRPGLRTAVQNARLGADWQLTPKTTVGILGIFFERNRRIEATNTVMYTTNGQAPKRRIIPNTETNLYRSFTGNINLVHKFSKADILSFDADYVSFDINRPSHYINRDINAAGEVIKESQLRIAMRTPIRVAVGKVDFESKLGKKLKFEAGTKISLMGFDNQTLVENLEPAQAWMIVPNLSSSARFAENVAGIYSSLGIAASEKTDIKVGLRYEYTTTNLGSENQPDIVDRRYGSLFPSVFVTRKLTDAQSLNFSYSRRVRRPQFSWLAPWLNFSDPTTFQKGNPALRPALTDALKLTYAFQNVQFSLHYSKESRALRPVSLVDVANDLQYNTYENLDNFRNAGADLSFRLVPAKWWEMQNNASMLYQVTNFQLEGESFQLRNAAYSFNSTQSFTLPKRFRLELSGDFDSPRYYSIAKWKATGSLNIGIQKDLGAKWGKLRFNVRDIFQTANWYGLTEQPDINLFVRTGFQSAERTFTLNWTKDFGNKDVKAARKRQTGAAEEMQRL